MLGSHLPQRLHGDLNSYFAWIAWPPYCLGKHIRPIFPHAVRPMDSFPIELVSMYNKQRVEAPD